MNFKTIYKITNEKRNEMEQVMIQINILTQFVVILIIKFIAEKVPINVYHHVDGILVTFLQNENRRSSDRTDEELDELYIYIFL